MMMIANAYKEKEEEIQLLIPKSDDGGLIDHKSINEREITRPGIAIFSIVGISIFGLIVMVAYATDSYLFNSDSLRENVDPSLDASSMEKSIFPFNHPSNHIGLVDDSFLPVVDVIISEESDVHTELNSLSLPNFVFILSDDLGWNSIGYQDYDLSFATPRLTSLAKSGLILSNYYSQEVCTPARAS